MEKRSRPELYRVGAYVVYPMLAVGGGDLLVHADTAGGLAAAAALLAGTLALPAALAKLCRQCAERPVPKFLRLAVMPTTVATALALRSAEGFSQFIAVLLLGLASVAFELAWREAGTERVAKDAD